MDADKRKEIEDIFDELGLDAMRKDIYMDVAIDRWKEGEILGKAIGLPDHLIWSGYKKAIRIGIVEGMAEAQRMLAKIRTSADRGSNNI